MPSNPFTHLPTPDSTAKLHADSEPNQQDLVIPSPAIGCFQSVNLIK